MALSRQDFEGVLDFVRDLYDQRGLDDFADRTAGALLRILSADRVIYGDFDVERQSTALSMQPTIVTESDGTVDGELHGAISGLEQRFATHPLYRYYLQTGDGEAQKLSQVMTRAQAARYRQNDPFPQQLNARFQMGVFFSAGAATVSTLIFVRAFRDFTAHERDLLNRLYPHLVQAFRNTASLKRICHDLDSVVEMLEGPTSSVVVLAGDGQVKRWTEQARTWIAQYCRTAFPAERNRLPECFNEWYRRQRSLIARETLLPAARDPLTVDKNGRQLTVQLIPDDFRDEHLLLLNEKAHDASWASLADCGLTPRESEVLAWVAKGKTNAEVGTILQLSGRTVQKHLEHIYDKLGVETRTTATVRALTVIGLHG